MNNMRQARIVDVIFVEVAETLDMFHRPYMSKYSDDIVNMADEYTQGGRNLSAQALAPISGMLLRPQAEPEKAVAIANGFGNKRFIVNIILQIDEGNLMTRYELVNGYTADSERSLQGSLNPRMRIFINNTTLINSMHGYQNAGASAADGLTVAQSTQILTPISGWSMENDHPIIAPNACTMRPMDAFTAMSTQAGMMSAGGVGDIGFPGGHGNAATIHDTRMQFGGRAKRSQRINNQQDQYLSRFFTTYREHAWAPDDGSQAGMTDNMFERAAAAVPEPMSVSDAFLKLITERTSYSSEWSIEWQDLINFDPTVATRFKIQPLNRQVHNIHGDHSNYSGWGAPTAEVQVGQMLLNLVPAMMTKYACGLLSFTMTNHTNGGLPVAVVSMAMGLTPAINLEHQRQAIEYELASSIFPQLSNGGMMMLELTKVTISMLTDSYMTVQVNGGTPTPLTAPTYCDSLFSPVLSHSDSALGTMAMDLGMLGGQLANNAPRPPISLSTNLADSYKSVGQPSGGLSSDTLLNFSLTETKF